MDPSTASRRLSTLRRTLLTLTMCFAVLRNGLRVADRRPTGALERGDGRFHRRDGDHRVPAGRGLPQQFGPDRPGPSGPDSGAAGASLFQLLLSFTSAYAVRSHFHWFEEQVEPHRTGFDSILLRLLPVIVISVVNFDGIRT